MRRLVAAFACLSMLLLGVTPAAAAVPDDYSCWHWYNSGGRHSYGGGYIYPDHHSSDVHGVNWTDFSNQASCTASSSGYKTQATNYHYHYNGHYGTYVFQSADTDIRYTGYAESFTAEDHAPGYETNRTLNWHIIWDSGWEHGSLPKVLED